ncbi:MAG: cytochrome d ubiquinol oxidase subunit II [Bacteroidales bacterium]
MVWIVLAFLGTALLFYVLLGGADFGAGILEIFTGKKGIDVISKAIAPVWEANHVWLIVVIVILFMGFPAVYSTMMLVLHIPMLLLLIGIILRGSSFTFRYYDIKQERLQNVYTAFFKFSSLFTPFFLGVILGSVILGQITLDMSEGFVRVFISPWVNFFSFSMGVFVVALFTFLASLYLLGEANKEKDILLFTRYARIWVVVLVLSGLLVFIAGEVDGLPLFNMFMNSTGSIISVVLATLLIPALWWSIHKHQSLGIRLIAGAQTVLVLLGWFMIQYPVLIKISGRPDITVESAVAPDATLRQLIIALIIGLMVVIPSLVYLFKVFKFGDPEPDY